MSTTIKEVLGTSATILASGELGGLTNNSSVVGSALGGIGVYDNTAGTGASSTSGDGYERGYVTFVLGGAFLRRTDRQQQPRHLLPQEHGRGFDVRGRLVEHPACASS